MVISERLLGICHRCDRGPLAVLDTSQMLLTGITHNLDTAKFTMPLKILKILKFDLTCFKNYLMKKRNRKLVKNIGKSRSLERNRGSRLNTLGKSSNLLGRKGKHQIVYKVKGKNHF